MVLERKKLSDLNAASYNPRKKLQKTDKQYEQIASSLDEFGLVIPIVWNKRTGNIVAGEQRWRILREQGVEYADVSIVDLPAEQEKVLNLALNKITGEWDMEKLPLLLQDLETADIDILLSGFEQYEVDLYTLNENAYGTEEDLLQSYIEPTDKKIRCPKCGHVDSKERFVSA